MNKIKAIKIAMLLSVGILISCIFSSTVFAVSRIAETAVGPDTFMEWDDGAIVSKSITPTGTASAMTVTAQTMGLRKGYYTFYLFENQKRNIAAFDGVSFILKNRRDEALKMNIAFSLNASMSVSLSDNAYIILEPQAPGSMAEIVRVTYGTFEVPGNFEGSVYIPFSQLADKDKKHLALKSVASWGFTTVMEQEQVVQYELSDVNFLRGSAAGLKQSFFDVKIIGKSEVTVPNEGTSITNYRAEIKDLDGNPTAGQITFYLDKDVSGASVSSSGALELNSDCLAKEIVLYARTASSLNAGKLVLQLQHTVSGTKNEGVPKESEVSVISTPILTRLTDSMVWIRIGLLTAVLVYIRIISAWFAEAKTNFHKIRKEILAMEHPQEEEEE